MRATEFLYEYRQGVMEMEDTPPEVLRALDLAAQKNGYRNWADVKANPRSDRAVMTVAKLANEIMKTTGPHHAEKLFYKNKTDVDENFADGNSMSTKDMIAYLRQHHDTNLHQDYLDHINTFGKFALKNIPVNTLKTELSGLDRTKVERYKQMDFDKAPPIVMGNGYILDGYHRAVAAKELGIPTIKGYVGVKKVEERYARKLNFDEIYGKYLKVTDNAGDPNKEGFSLVTPLNGDSWHWRERPEFKDIVKRKLNQPGWLGDHKYQQIIDAMSGQQFDPKRHLATENFADGKVKGKSRPGRVKRSGASCNGSVTDLRARAKAASGEKAKMYHWCANMKSGRKK